MQMDEETVFEKSSWDHYWDNRTVVPPTFDEQAFVDQAEQFTNEVVSNIMAKLKVS